MNELLFQSKESISNSLVAIILFIDDLFKKISQMSFTTDDDKDQIIILSEKLINLIDEIASSASTQVQVNSQQFTLNGLQLQYQIGKVTKNVFNQQLGLEKDLTDSFIVFVQKEQLDIYFNYLNISTTHLQELKTFLNQSQLEIDQQFYKKTKLQNYLYKNQYTNYGELKSNYLVDFTEYFYCKDTNLPAYSYQCVQYSNNGSLQLCNLLIQETINNKSIQVSCQCQSMGIIFLTRYQYQDENKNKSIQISQISENIDSNCSIYNQPFLLFHGIYVVFSLFMYFELYKLEISLMTEMFPTKELQKKNIIKFYYYQSNLSIFKDSIKFIHEIICLFYCQDQIIRKSYRFLKFSIFLTVLIPLSYFETFVMTNVTLYSILIINYLTLLFLRMIFKIFEAIYRFQGRCGVFIIILYIIIHFLSYLSSIQYIKNECIQELNYNMLILIGGTITLSYAILDPIFIYLRILLYSSMNSIIKKQELDSLIQFIYFFIQHYRLDEIFQEGNYF